MEQAPGLCSLLDKYGSRLYTDSTDSLNDNTEGHDDFPKISVSVTKKTSAKWTTELSPCLSKLLSAAQGLVKTLRLVHGIQRLREELPRSATAHSIQHRRDVCFSQAVIGSQFFGFIIC